MKLGQHMVRVEDGQKGIVCQNGPELRIMYVDRGEERLALRAERWVPDEINPGPLRREEIALVAWYADKALKGLERHEPFQFWQVPNLDEAPYDHGLAVVIFEYLRDRKPRAL